MTEDAPFPAEDDMVDLPIVATYFLNVTFRGSAGITAPTLSQVEEAVENVLMDMGGDGAVAVRAKAARTDR